MTRAPGYLETEFGIGRDKNPYYQGEKSRRYQSGVRCLEIGMARLSVRFSDWHVTQRASGPDIFTGAPEGGPPGDEIARIFDFSAPDLPGPNNTATLRIDCRLQGTSGGYFVHSLFFLYLRPFQLTQETSMTMGLFTEDRTAGCNVPVVATPFPGFKGEEGDWVLLAVMGSSEDAKKCVSAISSGKPLEFTLFNEPGETSERGGFADLRNGVGYFVGSKFVKLPLPNDDNFRRLYGEAYQRITHAQNEARQSAEQDEVSTDNATPISVDCGKWEVQGGGVGLLYHLTRTYSFSDRTGSNALIRVYFIVQSTGDLKIRAGMRVYVKPFPLPKERKFVLGLFTEDLKGGFVDVDALPNEEKAPFALDAALCVNDDDVSKCMSAIASGKDMTFLILNPAAPQADSYLKHPFEPLMKFNLPNDPEFKRLYGEVCGGIEKSHDATRARHLREGWYRRRP